MTINISEIEADLLKTLLQTEDAQEEAQHYHRDGDGTGGGEMVDKLLSKIESALDNKDKRLTKRLYPNDQAPVSKRSAGGESMKTGLL